MHALYAKSHVQELFKEDIVVISMPVRAEKITCKRCSRTLKASTSRQIGFCTECESFVKARKKAEDLQAKHDNRQSFDDRLVRYGLIDEEDTHDGKTD